VRGELRVFDTIKIPLQDANGSVWGLLGFARDMTELKRAGDELKRYRDQLEEIVQQRTAQLIESRQLLDKTFASLRDAILIIDTNTDQIVDCNPSATKIFGYSRKEMLGRTTTFLHVDKESFLDYQHRLATALERDGFLSLPEFQMKRRTGQTFPTELGVVPLEDDQGARFGWVTVVRDITERKRMEQYVLRTERLAAMGRLAAALAHEINNPLHGIASSLELVLDFPLTEHRRRQYLHAVQREIQRLRALSNRILDFARPPKIEQRFTHVPHIVRHALTLADKQLRESRIRVDTQLPNDLPFVLASPDQLTQVFLNLIINAIEEMPDGGELRITARQVQDCLELTFSDSGPGISPELMPLIFEPFYTTKADGTGLGLAISHSIVQQYGGTISARKASGGGAIFTVTVPIAHQEYCSVQEPG
jgi:PAS domain S-box-containing protein